MVTGPGLTPTSAPTGILARRPPRQESTPKCLGGLPYRASSARVTLFIRSCPSVWMPNASAGQTAERPPSTYTIWPVMKLDSSEASRTIGPTSSSGSPRRRIGISAVILE